MKGYGSHLPKNPITLRLIQMATTIVWMTRKRAVPNVRAIASENRPNASGS